MNDLSRNIARSAIEAVLDGRVREAGDLLRSTGRPVTAAASVAPLPPDGSGDAAWAALAEGMVLFEQGDPASAATRLKQGLEAEALPQSAHQVVVGIRARALLRSGDLVEGLTALRSMTTLEQVGQPPLGLAAALAGLFDDVNAPRSSLEILDRALAVEAPPVAWHELVIGSAHLVGSLDLRRADFLLALGQVDDAATHLERVDATSPRDEAARAIVAAGIATLSDRRAEAGDLLSEARSQTASNGLIGLHQLASLALTAVLSPAEGEAVFGSIDGDRCFGRARRRYHQVGRDLARSLDDQRSAYLHQRALLDLELGYRDFTQALSGGFGLFTSEAIAAYQQRRLAARLTQAELDVRDRRGRLQRLTAALDEAVDRLELAVEGPTGQSLQMVDRTLRHISDLVDHANAHAPDAPPADAP